MTTQSPPSPLFHYTSPQALQSIVESKKLRATQIQYLNDSRELKDGIRHLEVYLKQLDAPPAPIDPRRTFFVERMLAALVIYEDSHIFVASFSERADLLSQWRAYCVSGGYSIGFSAQLLTSADPTWRLVPCVYDSTEKVTLLAEIANRYLDDYLSQAASVSDPNLLGFQLAAEFSKEVYALLPRLKHKAFEEEKEWRLISPLGLLPTVWRAASATLVPCQELQLPFDQFPKLDVVVGPSAHQQLAIRSVGDFLRHKSLNASVRISAAPFRPVR